VQSGSEDELQGRTVAGAGTSSDDSSDFAEGFLFFKPVSTILCASTTMRGRDGGGGGGVYGRVCQAEAECDLTCPRRLLCRDLGTTLHRCQISNKIVKAIPLRKARNVGFGPDRRISRKEFMRMCRNLTVVAFTNVLSLSESAWATSVVISVHGLMHMEARKVERIFGQCFLCISACGI
jgi:hypothetical protein